MITIFMLHRVCPFEEGRLPPNENMKVSPEFLESFIVDLKEKGYDFISLDQVYEILQNKEIVEKKVVFTLDDGYRDNYEIAYPIFKKYNVPFTIYLTTSFPERTALLWWYVLEDIIINNDEVVLGTGQKIYCKSMREKVEAFMNIRKIILSVDQRNLKEFLDKLFSKYNIDWTEKCNELAMSWEQIIELSKDSLCTIGNHTKNHYALNKLSESEIISEIEDANRLIEEKIKRKVEHFAYPFGSRNEVNKREFDIVKKMGFKTATTTRDGNIFPEHRKYLECLPRVMLTEKFDLKQIGKIRKNRIVTI